MRRKRATIDIHDSLGTSFVRCDGKEHYRHSDGKKPRREGACIEECRGRLQMWAESKVDAVRTQIVDRLKESGHRVRVSDAGDVCDVDGIYVSTQISAEKSSRYPHSHTGRVYYSVGGYGRKQMFREGRDGLDVGKIAGAILDCVNRSVAVDAQSKDRQARREHAERTADRIGDEVGLDDFGAVVLDLDSDLNLRLVVCVHVDRAADMTALAKFAKKTVEDEK